jgi:thiol-disulfide isomerase/thioredoxin
MSGGGIVMMYDKDQDGAAVITLAGAAPPEYRPVLLDDDKRRFHPESRGVGRSSRPGGPVVSLSRWRMDPKILAAEKVALIGIEAVTPEYHRLAAGEATRQARKAGVETLPYPEIGQVFEFTLTTIDGKKVRSQDLRGKVVVIDCWANWCSPCMALLPEIKELHQKHQVDGLFVIGVSLNTDSQTTAKTCKRLGLDWPQVLAPIDENQRELWHKASGISTIPRLFVIDRTGVLQMDAGNLDAELITSLLKQASEPHKK